tara:strand:+ start:465 stop:716 length:252 start_codon:yes stop_codon:yes gene_type:complete
MRNRLERAYDELSIVTKDFANMPNRFYQLDTSVVNFLEDLVDLLDNRDQSDNIEDVQAAKELLDEVGQSLQSVLTRLEDDNEK